MEYWLIFFCTFLDLRNIYIINCWVNDEVVFPVQNSVFIEKLMPEIHIVHRKLLKLSEMCVLDYSIFKKLSRRYLVQDSNFVKLNLQRKYVIVSRQVKSHSYDLKLWKHQKVMVKQHRNEGTFYWECIQYVFLEFNVPDRLTKTLKTEVFNDSKILETWCFYPYLTESFHN